MPEKLFSIAITPDWESLLRCVRREGTPPRVHFIELLMDGEVKDAICERFRLDEALDRGDPAYGWKREIAIQRFLGYDYVACTLEGVDLQFNQAAAADTAALARAGGRWYTDEHRGPIASWAEFEAFPWPDPARAQSRALDWYETNLPEDMCLIGQFGFGHLAEHLTWLMGYETLCYALYDQPDLVAAISRRLSDISAAVVERLLGYSRVKMVWGSDDMGFKTGTLIGPKHLRAHVLPGHKRLAEMAHSAGRPYLLHSCGKLDAILPDLIDDVRIDARHSFEDVIEPVTEAKRRYGDRIALLGGLDVDFLCRASEGAVRQRTREVLDVCQPGGGYCLGTGNSVANYVPLDNYLAMLDEGRRYA
jgi:uroporphyrinogen decarboxylase